jgi:branched-chain amino acid transport system ATP-binding protein
MVRKIYETIATIAGEGVTILLVEQNANLALKVSRRAYVMESGVITLAGVADDLACDPKIRAAYLGE